MKSTTAEGKLEFSASTTEQAFGNGHGYTAELKRVAESPGIAPAARLRKDEFKTAIALFLRRFARAQETASNVPEI